MGRINKSVERKTVMSTFFLAFHFEDLVNPILVKYKAEKDLRYETEDCTQSYIDSDTV